MKIMSRNLPNLVQIPEEWKSFFNESGYTSTIAMEARGNARLRVRSDAILKFVSRPRVLEQHTELHAATEGIVILKDLSRSGIGFLYHEIIYPQEVFTIDFQNRRLYIVAVRCRRLGPSCYEIGGDVRELEQLEDVYETEV